MIYIQTINKYWTPGEKILEGKSKSFRKDFEYFLCREFIRYVQEAIRIQRYKKSWSPLSPRYIEYKRKHGLSLNTWEATGQLKKTLTVLGKSTLTIGWDKRATHKQSKEKLHKIAVRLEYGNPFKNLPPRPLFRLVYEYFRKNVSYFYKKFVKHREANKPLNKQFGKFRNVVNSQTSKNNAKAKASVNKNVKKNSTKNAKGKGGKE